MSWRYYKVDTLLKFLVTLWANPNPFDAYCIFSMPSDWMEELLYFSAFDDLRTVCNKGRSRVHRYSTEVMKVCNVEALKNTPLEQ